MPAISASAPGKIILCGEHSVVYGFPAIAIPVFEVSTRAAIFARPSASSDEVIIKAPLVGLDATLDHLSKDSPLRVTIDLVLGALSVKRLPPCEIRITSTIPVASGLGSSASVSVALIRTLSTFLGHPLADGKVNALAFEVEKLHHGTPSGIDNTVVTYQKPVYFKRETPIDLLEVGSPIDLLIADSGIGASTAEAVQGVRDRWQQEQDIYDRYFNAIGEIVKSSRAALENGQIELLGDLMNQNQDLLRKIQVSSPALDTLISAALDAGASGAKLSGGGLGGNILALVEVDRIASVRKALTTAGAVRVLHTRLPFKGMAG